MRSRIAIALLAAPFLCGAGVAKNVKPTAVSLYGITLGAPLNLPRCGEATVPVCFFTIADVDVAVLGHAYVHFEGIAPVWWSAANDAVNLTVLEGKVEQIIINTRGAEFQGKAAADLSAKFGAPSKTSTSVMQNQFGAKFNIATSAWQSGDVLITLTGAGRSLADGEVRAITAAGIAWQKKANAEHKAREPKL